MFRKKAYRINPYLGYGTKTRLRATGRALEDENIHFGTNQNIFKTLRNIFRQLESDEVPGIDIELKLSDGKSFKTKTDEEGYYNLDVTTLELSKLMDKEGWIPYQVSFNVKNLKRELSNDNKFRSQMLIPSTDAEFGIISDIDDTILHTGVASLFKWRLIQNTIFKNYDERIALEGTSTFYQKLGQGKNKKTINPFFYISNSPWNLYDYLSAFLKKHNFPKGPVLLRDFRTPLDKTPKPSMPHKQSEILNLLNLYPDLKFILIGDCGEKDADIYMQTATEFPNRILSIYLRSVNSNRKMKRIKKITHPFDSTPILLVNTSEEAIDHAKTNGFIT